MYNNDNYDVAISGSDPRAAAEHNDDDSHPDSRSSCSRHDDYLIIFYSSLTQDPLEPYL